MKELILFLLSASCIWQLSASAVPAAKDWSVRTIRDNRGDAKVSLEHKDRSVVASSDFSNGGNSAGAYLAFPENFDCRKVKFSVETPYPYLVIETIDRTGQHHFFFQKHNTAGKQVYEIDKFGDPNDKKFRHWGGANDGVVHHPVKGLWIRWVANAIPEKQTVTVISDVTAGKFSLADAGETYSPAKSGWSVHTIKDKRGDVKTSLEHKDNAVLVKSDFTNGGNSAGAYLSLKNEPGCLGMTFRIETPYKSLVFETVDKTGQHHFFFLNHDPAAGAQEFTVSKFGDPKDRKFRHWGGANDGVVHQPLKGIWIRWVGNSIPARDTVTVISDVLLLKPETPLQGAVDNPADLVGEAKKKTVKIDLNRAADRDSFGYEVFDYSGNSVKKGTAALAKDQRSFLLPFPDENGFFEYRIADIDMTVGMVAAPYFGAETDPFWGVDGAFSVFSVFRTPAIANAYFKVLDFAGIRSVRDRLRWSAIEWKKGDFSFDALSTETLLKTAAENNCRVVSVFHDAPPWTGSESNRKSEKYYPYPRDLKGMAESFSVIGRRFAPYWDGLEVWNEPELDFGAGLPGDHSGALLRTISRTFSAAGVKVPVVSGVFCGGNSSPQFIRSYLVNGLLESADVMSFHYYGTPERIGNTIRSYRQNVQSTGKGAIPFWVTECGKAWPRGTVRAKVKDDLVSASGITVMATESKAYGAARFYMFCLAFYNENSNNFAMFDINHTPMRSFAAYMTCARMLAHSRYAGDMNGSRVFRRGDTAVVVMRPGSLLPGGISGSFYTPDGRIAQKPGDAGYAVLPFKAAEPYIKTETEAMETLLLSENKNRSGSRIAPAAVFRHEVDRSRTAWNEHLYLMDDPANFTAKLEVFNLDGKNMEIRPRAKCLASGKTADIPAISLAPGERKSFDIKMDLTAPAAKRTPFMVQVQDLNNHARPLTLVVRTNDRETMTIPPEQNFENVPKRYPESGDGWFLIQGNERWRRWEGHFLPNIRSAVRAAWSKDKIRMQVLVEDEKFSQPYRLPEAWRADSVQIALQSGPARRNRKAFTELLAAQTQAGGELYRFRSEWNLKTGKLDKSTVKFTQTASKLYMYDIELDMAELGLKELNAGDTMGFSILINSSNGKGRDGYLCWGDGLAVSKNPNDFNRIRIGK